MRCCFLLGFLCELYYDARIHKHQVYKENRFKRATTFILQTNNNNVIVQ